MIRAESKVQHRAKPAEPYAIFGQFGRALRVTPGSGHIPGQAYVEWSVPEGQSGFETWEPLSKLKEL